MRLFAPAMTIACLLAVPALGEISSYECNLLPADDGWTPWNEYCGAVQWIDDGWLVQDVDSCPDGPPPFGQVLDYTRSLAEYGGAPEFWAEWRMYTDGPSTEFPGIGPAHFSVGGTAGVNYGYTIAKDLAKLNRDNLLPIIFVPIEPGVPHIHRLELYGDELYVWLIDGVVADAGRPEGPFPPEPIWSPGMNMGARSIDSENMVWWDYIRWGSPIPEPASLDIDTDADVDDTDYYFFQDCLTLDGPALLGGPENDAGPGCTWADSDNDGDVDLKDIAAFQNAYTGEGD